MIKYFLYFSLFMMGCTTSNKKDNTNNDLVAENKTEKIEQVEVTTAGGMQGSYANCKITKDSIIINFSLAVDSLKNYTVKRTNNQTDWENFIYQINLVDFKKATNGKSMLPVDGADTEIKIKTNNEEISKVNADPNKTWVYILGFIDKYFKQ